MISEIRIPYFIVDYLDTTRYRDLMENDPRNEPEAILAKELATPWTWAEIDGRICVGMKGNLDFTPDATLIITGGFLRAGDSDDGARKMDKTVAMIKPLHDTKLSEITRQSAQRLCIGIDPESLVLLYWDRAGECRVFVLSEDNMHFAASELDGVYKHRSEIVRMPK